jgi:PII-like signaling protein
MKKESQAVLLRIFIGESDSHDGKALYEYLVEYLRKHDFSGVTVLRGIEGYGHSSVIHSANVLDLSTDLPIVIEVVDTGEKIEALKKMLDETHGEKSMFVTEETVKIVRYGKQV